MGKCAASAAGGDGGWATISDVDREGCRLAYLGWRQRSWRAWASCDWQRRETLKGKKLELQSEWMTVDVCES